MGISDDSYKNIGFPITKSEKAFETYRSYLSSIIADFVKIYSTLDNFAEHAWKECELTPLRRPPFDSKTIRRYLIIAWNTEYLLELNNFSEIDIVKISNQWRPIQAYYSIYSAGEAVSYVIDGSLVESHNKCIAKLNSFFVERVRIRPFCLCYTGSTRRGIVSKNIPAGVAPVNNLSRIKSTPVNLIATCVRAEHRNRIDEFEPKKLTKVQRKKGQKKRLKLDYDPGYTTMLNFLYRLRIKSNYKDAEIFISDSPDEYIKKFSKDLTSIVNVTLLLFEIIIIRRWGTENFARLAQSYLKSFNYNKQGSGSPLERRLQIYGKITDFAFIEPRNKSSP